MDPPQRNHKGEGSYRDRMANYNEAHRQSSVQRNTAMTTEDGLK